MLRNLSHHLGVTTKTMQSQLFGYLYVPIRVAKIYLNTDHVFNPPKRPQGKNDTQGLNTKSFPLELRSSKKNN